MFASVHPGKLADRVQELRIKVIHILIELVERHLHPQKLRLSTGNLKRHGKRIHLVNSDLRE